MFSQGPAFLSEIPDSLAPRSRLLNAKLLVNLGWRSPLHSGGSRRLSPSFSLMITPYFSVYISSTTTCHDTIIIFYTFVPNTPGTVDSVLPCRHEVRLLCLLSFDGNSRFHLPSDYFYPAVTLVSICHLGAT